MTIEQLAEIVHEAVRKIENIDAPWARLPKTGKLEVTEGVKKALDVGSFFPDKDASVAAKLRGAILGSLVDQVEGHEDFWTHFGGVPSVGVDLAGGKDETVITKVVLNNQNPPFIGIKQGSKMILSAKIELGSTIMVKGHAQSHRDYPCRDNVELMEL
jgi:hypothetical protein